MKKIAVILALGVCLDAGCQEVVHPKIGDVFTDEGCGISIELIGKKQNYEGGDGLTRDTLIHSPKSVNIHPNGQKYYVNSLEGGTTIAYDFTTGRKLKSISHVFEKADSGLWAKASGFFVFNHQYEDTLTFLGKPVESAFSHNGKYLWVPYYRRSFDLNAQDPSAVAIIDTEKDEIVRLMETGPLPKMVAVSGDNHYVAITHWGDNTVGLIDISDEKMENWRYCQCFVIDEKLKLDFSLDKPVDRDNESGYCLRGTVFTPDNKYLLVGCMTGSNGIAVIDLERMEYLGRVCGTLPNVRHLIVKNGYLYLSINRTGYVQRIRLEEVTNAAKSMTGKTTSISGWESCQVGVGARTIECSPDGKYIFAACNNSSSLYVVDTEKMSVVTKADVDSYPVGLDISKDGQYVFTTSQGRTYKGKDRGGNAVDIFKISYSNNQDK